MKSLALKIDAGKEREVALRDQLDKADSTRAWWKSPITPYVAVAALVASIYVANLALEAIDWWYWSPRLAPWLLALAPVVNVSRWAFARFRRQRRLERIKTTGASN